MLAALGTGRSFTTFTRNPLPNERRWIGWTQRLRFIFFQALIFNELCDFEGQVNDSITVKRGIAKVVGLQRPEGRHTTTHTYLLAPPEGSGAVTPHVPRSRACGYHKDTASTSIVTCCSTFLASQGRLGPSLHLHLKLGTSGQRHSVSTSSTDVCVWQNLPTPCPEGGKKPSQEPLATRTRNVAYFFQRLQYQRD